MAESVGRDSLRTFGFGLVGMTLSLAMGVVLAKALGPQGKGEFSIVQLLQAAALAPTAGVGMGIVYQLTRKGRSLADIARPLIVIGLAACVIIWTLVAVWAALRGAQPPLVVFAATTPAVVLVAWQSPIFLGLGWLRRLNAQGVALAAALLLTVTVATYALRLGTPGALWSWSFCQWAIALSVVIQTAPLALGARTLAWRDGLRDLLEYGWKSGLGATLNYLNYRVDSIAIIALVGVAGFGIYSVAVAASELLFRISGSIGAAIVKRVGTETAEHAAQTVMKANRASVAAVGATAAALFLLAPALIPLLYGGRFTPAIPALRILLPGVVAFSGVSILGSYFSYQLGRPIFMLYMSIASIVVETGGCLVLVPRMGITGAALASTLTYAIAAVGNTWYFCAQTGASPVALWLPTAAEFKTLIRMIPRPAFPSVRT